MEASNRPGWVGRYQLLERLGEGGMGVVYLARSLTGERVAVKVVRDRYAGDPDYRARFRREVAAARKVTGTFTAPVLDADPDAAVPWLVTEYLPGMSLWEAVHRYGPLPVAAVQALAAGLAEALAAIHRAGVVHRDLKPGNVMLTAGGPRVIDFGVARPEDAVSITRVGASVPGTPGFRSPEQATGGKVRYSSDIFVLGTVLAFAATGQLLFGAPGPDGRPAELGEPDLSGVADDLLRDVVQTCLRRRPARRPTAAALLARLGAAPVSLLGTGWLPPPVAQEIDGRSALATAEPDSGAPGHLTAADAVMGAATADSVVPVAAEPTDRHTPPDGRHRLLSRRKVLSGVAGAGALAAAGIGLWWDQKPARPSVKRSTPPARAASGTTPRATLRWKVQVSAYYPDLAVAGGVVLAWTDEGVQALDPGTGRVLWRRKVERGTVAGDTVYAQIDTIKPVGITRHPWEIAAIRAASGATAWTYRPRPVGRYRYDFALRGPVVSGPLAVIGGLQQVVAVNAADGRPRWVTNASAASGVAVSGGVVGGLNEVLTGLDAGSGRKRWTYPGKDAMSLAAGDALFFVGFSDSLHAVRAADGKLSWQQQGIWGPGIQYDGGMLYSADPGGTVRALRAATGQLVWSRRLSRDRIGDPAWSNAVGLSGRTLYANGDGRTVYAMDATDGRVLWTYDAQVTRTSAPVTVAGSVFVGGKDGYVLALAPPSGR